MDYPVIDYLSSIGGSLCLWFVRWWCWLGQKEHPSHRVLTQSVVYTLACHSHVCCQLHCPSASWALCVPHLQEANAHRPELHHSSDVAYSPVTRPLDPAWGCPALWHQIKNSCLSLLTCKSDKNRNNYISFRKAYSFNIDGVLTVPPSGVK